MTSLITLPIRLPLEITYRAAKLGAGVVRTVAGILGAPAEGGGSGTAWPAAEDVERDYGDNPPSRVEAPIDFDAPSEEELAPVHVDSEPALAYEAGPGEDVGAEVRVDPPWDGYD